MIFWRSRIVYRFNNDYVMNCNSLMNLTIGKCFDKYWTKNYISINKKQ